MKTLKMMALCYIGVLFFASCEQMPTAAEEPAPIVAPDIIIPVQEAENMYHRYGEDRANLIEANINIDDQGNPIASDDPAYVQATRSLTVDYKQLKQYLAFIEQEAASTKTDITGLRIYLAQYGPSKNNGRSTVFLNPVKQYGDGGISDDVAFAIDKSGKEPKAVYVDQCFKVPSQRSNQANLTMPVQGNIQSLAGNDFPFRPPPTNDPDYQ